MFSKKKGFLTKKKARSAATTDHQTHENTSINTLGHCAVHIETVGCVWMHLELYLGSAFGQWSDPSEGVK